MSISRWPEAVSAKWAPEREVPQEQTAELVADRFARLLAEVLAGVGRAVT